MKKPINFNLTPYIFIGMLLIIIVQTYKLNNANTQFNELGNDFVRLAKTSLELYNQNEVLKEKLEVFKSKIIQERIVGYRQILGSDSKLINDSTLVLAVENAIKYKIPVPLFIRQLKRESMGDPLAVSHKGAMGLLQIMPQTFKMIIEETGLPNDVFDEATNIEAGAYYLSKLRDKYRSKGYSSYESLARAILAYNGGRNSYDNANGSIVKSETDGYFRYIFRIGNFKVDLL
jgi:soluble lytic murein transglycosylase-like protein